MSEIRVIQNICDICGASVSSLIRAGNVSENTPPVILSDLMPKHLAWHKSQPKKELVVLK